MRKNFFYDVLRKNFIKIYHDKQQIYQILRKNFFFAFLRKNLNFILIKQQMYQILIEHLMSMSQVWPTGGVEGGQFAGRRATGARSGEEVEETADIGGKD